MAFDLLSAFAGIDPERLKRELAVTDEQRICAHCGHDTKDGAAFCSSECCKAFWDHWSIRVEVKP